MLRRQGLLIILSSPSGAGKSTLSQRIIRRDPDTRFSVSATTRPPRPGEVEGREYYFRSRAEFERLVAEGGMLEHAEVFGNLYGSPRAPVEAALAEGVDVIFDVDWQGGAQIRASALRGNCLSVFILPPSIAALESRLRGRGQDSEAVVRRRMDQARDEISHWQEYDYVLINDDLDRTDAALAGIIAAERLRRPRQPQLARHVDRLNAEYDGMAR
jgi:guanylate kinase